MHVRTILGNRFQDIVNGEAESTTLLIHLCSFFFFVHCKGSGSYLNELNCAVDSAVSSPASYSPALHTLSHVSDDPKRLREQSV